MSEITDFYRRPGPISDLGRHRELVHGLPADAEALGVIVRGLLVHNFAAKMQGLRFPAERMEHMQTASAEAILDKVLGLGPGPIDRERPVEWRVVGFCYHSGPARGAGSPATSRRAGGSTIGWSSTETAAAGGSRIPRSGAMA